MPFCGGREGESTSKEGETEDQEAAFFTSKRSRGEQWAVTISGHQILDSYTIVLYRHRPNTIRTLLQYQPSTKYWAAPRLTISFKYSTLPKRTNWIGRKRQKAHELHFYCSPVQVGTKTRRQSQLSPHSSASHSRQPT